MNTCVSDDQVIINVQGIRTVSWGESTTVSYSNPGRPWFITINYKGSHNTYYYKHEHEVRAIYNKVREAMDKTAKEIK